MLTIVELRSEAAANLALEPMDNPESKIYGWNGALGEKRQPHRRPSFIRRLLARWL